MKIFSFEIPKEKWNIVSEVGLPKEDDGMWCVLVCKNFKDEFTYRVGGYNEYNNTFYLNCGYGGMVIDAENVVAWVSLFDPDDSFLKVE